MSQGSLDVNRIVIEHSPTHDHLKGLGVFEWPIWVKEESEFHWTYDEPETCYFLEGQVTVSPDGGSDPVHVGKGDFVRFPAGLSCTWKVHEAVKKHYWFG